MKFACLVYMEESTLELIDDAECMTYSEKLMDRGVRVAAEALESVVTATTSQPSPERPASQRCWTTSLTTACARATGCSTSCLKSWGPAAGW